MRVGSVPGGIPIAPAPLSAKLPLVPKVKVGAGNTFACVPKLMLPAEVNKLPVAAVNTPLSVISPVTDVADNAPPTVDVPRFKLAELIDAAPVPSVLSATAPVKLLVCVARLMLWLPVRALKLPPAAVSTPLSLTPPVAAVPVNTPPTFDAAKFKLVEFFTAALPALLRATAPVRLLVCVDKSIVPADVKVLVLASVSTPLSVIAPVV